MNTKSIRIIFSDNHTEDYKDVNLHFENCFVVIVDQYGNRQYINNSIIYRIEVQKSV